MNELTVEQALGALIQASEKVLLPKADHILLERAVAKLKEALFPAPAPKPEVAPEVEPPTAA